MPDTILTGDECENFTRNNMRNTQYNTHYFSECDVCGRLDWSSSCNKDEPQVVFQPRSENFHQDHDYCTACADVRQRNPEIYSWIIGVITKHIKPSTES